MSAPTRSSRWGAISGIVVFGYAVILAVAISQIGDRNRFNRWGGALGSLGARLVLAVVVGAALFHALDGLRRMVQELAPGIVARDQQLRAGVLFLTWALALPAAAVIVWPWIAETTR
jgi:succinate dehydrogenase/fumarate reductase cytochrome b subunit